MMMTVVVTMMMMMTKVQGTARTFSMLVLVFILLLY